MSLNENTTDEFEQFIDSQTSSDNDGYEYDDNTTIKNRGKDLLNSSIGRLESTYKRFIKQKKGTCWELAQSMDYHLLKKGKKNHHIVATKTGTLTCHTFNLYVEQNVLHIIDLYQHVKDTEIDNLKDLKNLKSKMYDDNYKNWYVMSEVKNNFLERFKKLGSKRWAPFCGESQKDGGFLIINDKEFKVNPKVKWSFNPFKFLAWG